jgi:hypothetical protein
VIQTHSHKAGHSAETSNLFLNELLIRSKRYKQFRMENQMPAAKMQLLLALHVYSKL